MTPIQVSAQAIVERMQSDPVASLHVQIAIFSVALENAHLRIAELEAEKADVADESPDDKEA